MINERPHGGGAEDPKSFDDGCGGGDRLTVTVGVKEFAAARDAVEGRWRSALRQRKRSSSSS